MRKQMIALLLIYSTGLWAQQGRIASGRVPVPSMHYEEEYSFDSTTNTVAWNRVGKGVQVSFATTNELFFRTEVPPITPQQNGQLTGWKGERVNAQLLVWSRDTVEQVRFRMHDLKTATGATLSKEQLKVQLVRYVVSNYPYAARNTTCDFAPDSNLFLMPDRFESFERFDLPGKTVRPVWLSVDIPPTAKTGVYKGTLEMVTASGTIPLQLQLEVQDMVLPRPSEWKHRLDLWQNPWVVALKNHVTPWSPEHKLLLKKHLQLYADAGGSYITTYAVHSPWSDNSYTLEGSMMEWIREKNGSWKFDYSIFDDYVQLAMDAGVKKAITIYTPVPWGFRFRYLDAATGNYEYATWPPDSEAFRAAWNIFLTDLKKHLEAKGWFSKTYLGINENEMAHTLAAIKVIRDHSKSWKITYAGDWHPELDSLLDDYSFLYGKESDVQRVQQRTARGQSTTYYVCCNPPVPNTFVFSPPAEARWLSWYTAAHRYDGFLRWAYDAWPDDPQRDARHVLWPAGDCFLVYPGGYSCIRFEKLREGIVDFEKMRILRQMAAKSANKNVQQLLQQLDQHLQTLLEEKEFAAAKVQSDLEKGNRILQQLTEALSPSGKKPL